MKKLFVSVILCIFILSVCVAAAPAAVVTPGSDSEPVEDSGQNVTLNGDGTKTNPYQLSTASDFLEAASLINAGKSDYNSAYYVVTDNIDFAGVEYVPLGADISCAFYGNFDGCGHKLYNLSVNDVPYFGIIGCMTSGTVKNVNVEYVSNNEELVVLSHFGGIVGYLYSSHYGGDGNVNISKCVINGNVEFSCVEFLKAGALAGEVKATNANIYVYDCLSNLDISVTGQSDVYVGGFSGYLDAESSKSYTFSRCVSTGDLYVNVENHSVYMGGFAGYVNKDESGWSGWADEGELYASKDFVSCIATGNVIAEHENDTLYTGGFIATIVKEASTSKCYCSNAQIVSGYKKEVHATAVTPSKLADPSYLKNTVGIDTAQNFRVDEFGNFRISVFDLSESRVSVSGFDTAGVLAVCTYSDLLTMQVKMIPFSEDVSKSFEELEIDLSGVNRIKAFIFMTGDNFAPACENKIINIE